MTATSPLEAYHYKPYRPWKEKPVAKRRREERESEKRESDRRRREEEVEKMRRDRGGDPQD